MADTPAARPLTADDLVDLEELKRLKYRYLRCIDLKRFDDLVDVLPPMGPVAAGLFRHLPWVVLLVVLGAIFVATAYAGGGDDPATTGTDEPRCVDVAPGPTTTVVECDGPHDLEIVVRVDELTQCPEGTQRRRLATDGLLDCVIET